MHASRVVSIQEFPLFAQSGSASDAPPTWYEKALVLVGFIVLLGVFKSLLGSDSRTDGSLLFQVIAGGVYLSAIMLLVIRGIPVWMFTILMRAWPLVLLTLLTVVSTLWSQSPETTLRRSIALLLSSSFALFIVVRFDVRSVFNLFAVAFVAFCSVSILAVAVPGVGIVGGGEYAGAWQGLTGNKNTFGRTIAVGVALLPVAALLRLLGWRRLVLFLSPIAVVLLLLSRSATSFVTAFASVGVGTILYVGLGGRLGRVRVRPEIGIPFLVIAGVAGFLLVTFGWTAILEALGRDPTLTGRTKLWNWAIGINEARQWLGSGFRAFWIDQNTLYFSETFWWGVDADGNRNMINHGPGHAHSGYVDTYLELGRLGVTLLALLLTSAIMMLRRRLSHGSDALGLMFSIVLSFLLIYAITERSILQQSEDLWFFFSMLYLYIVKDGVQFDVAAAQLPLDDLAVETAVGGRGVGIIGGATG